MSKTSLPKTLFKSAKAVAGFTLTTIGAGIAYSFLGIDHDVPLETAVDAERKQFTCEQAGQLSYYVDDSGSGRPLLLIHSINAAPSTHEMRPLFDHYRGTRPVYSLDLPGYGFSERSDRRYSPQLYAGAIAAFVRDVVETAVDAVALSLGCEFLALAAQAEPTLFHSLVLISPTGMSKPIGTGPNSGNEQLGQRVHSYFSFPLWSQPFYDLLTSRISIRYYLGKSFVGEPPPDFLAYAYDTSHQPGARYAPLYFLSGQLFTYGVRTAVYETIDTPTLVIYDRDANVSFDKLPDLLEKNEAWQAVRIVPTMGLPHWEKLPETTAALNQFWSVE